MLLLKCRTLNSWQFDSKIDLLLYKRIDIIAFTKILINFSKLFFKMSSIIYLRFKLCIYLKKVYVYNKKKYLLLLFENYAKTFYSMQMKSKLFITNTQNHAENTLSLHVLFKPLVLRSWWNLHISFWFQLPCLLARYAVNQKLQDNTSYVNPIHNHKSFINMSS